MEWRGGEKLREGGGKDMKLLGMGLNVDINGKR